MEYTLTPLAMKIMSDTGYLSGSPYHEGILMIDYQGVTLKRAIALLSVTLFELQYGDIPPKKIRTKIEMKIKISPITNLQ